MEKLNIPRLVLLFLLFCVTSVWAVDPGKQMTQYAHTAWRTQDGFFYGVPNTIAQTTDGYLWIATQDGLLRFDGVRFVPWEPKSGKELLSSDIYALLGARDGSLWIGTAHGLGRLVDGNLIQYPNLPGGVTAIMQRADGEIWFSYRQIIETAWGICRVVGAQTQCSSGANSGIPLVEDASGSLWTGYGATLTRWKLGSFTTYAPHRKELVGAAGVVALAPARDGSIWVGMASAGHGAGLQQFTNGAWKPFIAGYFDSSTLEVTALLLDRENTLWVGTSQGLYRIRGRQVDHFGSSDGLSSDYVSEMGLYEDREGNMWVATSQGLDCFHDLPVTTYTIREGLPTGEVDSVLASRDGTIWLGGTRSLVALRQEQTPRIEAYRAPGSQVTSLLEDHAGQLWVGVDDFLTVYKNGAFRRIDRPEGKPIGLVVGMTEDVDRNIWVETTGEPRTLFRIQDFEVREALRAPRMPAARRIAPDSEGGIWLGLMSGDLARYKNANLEIFPFRHSAVAGFDSKVDQLLVTSDGAVLGATHFGMIAWREGTRQTLTVRNGLPCNGVNALVFDNQGDLWLYLQCGLVEVPSGEMQNWWQKPDTIVHVRTLDSLDGVRPGQAPFAAGARSPDGRLWFVNGYALQQVDPTHLSRNSIPPPVHIEEIIADRKNYALGSPLRLPSITQDLEIDYTALSFMVPQKVHFRYKLEGRDEGWQEPGTRRQAFYGDLHPGNYRFRVIACNNDGVWNEEGATLDFSIAPAWFQTTWFRLLCVVIGTFVVWAIYRLRVRQIATVISARFDERLAERTRMARELHDTFLQTIQGSKLVADDALDPSTDLARMRHAMEQLSAWLEQATREGRAALNSLRTSTTQKNDLAEAFRRATENGLMPGSMQATFSVVGDAKEMHPIVRDEVYRIGYEAIRNAFKHSQASRLEVELRYAQDLALQVRDNGVGIDPSTAALEKDGHFGLRGMRERAARIGGKLTLVSSANSGTEITVVVPGGIVFQKKTATPFEKMKALLRRMG